MQEPQRVALPALLRQGLVAFREVQGSEQRYKVTDNWKGLTFQFETWQFFVLEVLPVCEEFPKLASVFEDRFGRPITNEEVEELFSLVNEMKLFGASADSHPMVADFNKKRGIRLAGDAPELSSQGSDAKSSRSAGDADGKSPPPRPYDPAIRNTADFTAEEFKDQKKDIAVLIQKIKNDGHQLGPINFPENTVEWLNGILQVPDLSDQLLARKSNLILTEEIKKLNEQTEKNRKGIFNNLKVEDQNAIRRLNRLLIEHVYPQETPKTPVLDTTTTEEKGWHLFNPAPLIKLIFPLLQPFKYTVYVLPALLIVALFTAVHNADLMSEDFDRFFIGMKYAPYTYAWHVLIGMFTDNLLAILISALVAYSYRATVKSFYIEFHFGFYPRFHVRIGNTQQLSRREKIWLYAAPLLGRVGMISACILLWFGTRTMTGPLPALSMTIGAIAVASLFLTVSPLIKSSGYHLLAAVLNEPQLRSKAALALVNKFRGNIYQKLDNNLLVAYALASSLYMVATFAVFIMMFGVYVKFHFGGAGSFLIVLIIFLLILRLSKKVKQIGEIYERTIQYERWKNRALPKVDDALTETESKSSSLSHAKVFIVSLIVLGLVMPYNYEPGGYFVVLPNQKAELTSENAAIINKVYFDGGEVLKAGTVIAQLSYIDPLGQLNIYTAKVQEQQAVVDDLKSRPKPEEVALAERELEVQKTRSLFSKEKLDRYEKLYKQKTISFEDFEDHRRQCEVDVNKVNEIHAKLELIKTGATPDQIAAAEGKLQSLKEECDYYKEKIAQSLIHMPFDGRLVGINLKQKIGHYLNKGEVFAVAENTNQVFAQIEVPEPDIRYVAPSARIRVRFFTYYNEDITGVVKSIDTIVTEKRSGNVVKVLTLLDNKDGRLQSGMTGQAKISSKIMPAWDVLSLAIIRFFEVEVWSWIP
ncbi:MAG: efflux RND transporter periplasmic adaptor subunit [Syntrophales bacterium]